MMSMPRNKRMATAFLTAMVLGFMPVVGGQVPVQPQKQTDDDVVRINTELVLLNVAVFDEKGRFVPGLRQEDFTLLDDGVPQRIDHFSTEDTPFAAAILIDASGSMKTKLPRARVAAAHFQELIRRTDAVSIFCFNTAVDRVQDFSSDRDIDEKVWMVEARGSTRLYDGIATATEALAERSEQRRAVVLISDGDDTNSATNFGKVLRRVLQEDIAVYSVDLVDPASMARDAGGMRAAALLRELADKSGGRYFLSPGGRELEMKFEEVVKELRQQYTVGFYPKEQVTGYHKLDVRLRRPGLRWRTRQGYY